MKQDPNDVGMAVVSIAARKRQTPQEYVRASAAARLAKWSAFANSKLAEPSADAGKNLEMERFAQFVSSIPLGVLIACFDPDNPSAALTTRVMNPAMQEIVNQDSRRLIGSSFEQFLSALSPDSKITNELHRLVCQVGLNGLVTNYHAVLVADDRATTDERATAVERATARCLDIRIVPIATTGVALIFEDVTVRSGSERMLRQRALTDELTSLANRSVLLQKLEEHERAHDGSSLTLLLIDLDGFKEVNDTFGHEFGDQVLKQVSTRFAGEAPWDALVARLGGDEFGVLLAPNSSTDEGVEVAMKLADSLRRPIELGPRLEVKIGASIGIASVPDHAELAPMLLARADMAMYSAKRRGGGFAVFESEQGHTSVRKMSLLGDLHRAIGSGELTLHYQPVIDINGSIVGAEGLIRWNHPELGLIYPSEFIDLIELGNLSNALALTVVRQAVQQAQVAHTSGFPIGLSVNLSPRDLHDPHLVQTIARLIEDSLLPRGTITVEITERQLFAEAHEVSSAIADLRAAGARVSIDDFGTGNTSMYLLRRIDVDELKIDEVFIQDLLHGREHVVKAIIDMAHELGLSVVAEGVEEHETIGVLRALGCDRMQGYALSHPVRADAFAELLRSWQHTMV
jgi:diguanylate cyclase (GGDEF)-like protein